ncbi:MAG: hypothetical protein MUO54_14545 [Anaerolineales bacterium]|nr:hypothetical protein [Anaerolineales bacterium]
MKKLTLTSIIFVLLFASCQTIYGQKVIKHYIFFSRDRELIHDSSFYSISGIDGAQITYVWKQLEPRKNTYDFSEIEADLDFLNSKGKKLFIQIQDVTFSSSRILTPNYMLNDTTYHGGSDPQYWEDDDGKLVKGGWVARRWDTAVANQYRELLVALAKKFDGRIEGINIPETAIDIVDPEGRYPMAYSDSIYIEELKKTMLTLSTHFKQSVPILYANFMPGDSKANLNELYEYAEEIGLGMGGPDIKVYRKGQMENSYPLIRDIAGKVPIGLAVQDGNYSIRNPKTDRQVTISEILEFAQNYLMVDYIFWCTEEPYYSEQVLPLLNMESLKLLLRSPHPNLQSWREYTTWHRPCDWQ